MNKTNQPINQQDPVQSKFINAERLQSFMGFGGGESPSDAAASRHGLFAASNWHCMQFGVAIWRCMQFGMQCQRS